VEQFAPAVTTFAPTTGQIAYTAPTIVEQVSPVVTTVDPQVSYTPPLTTFVEQAPAQVSLTTTAQTTAPISYAPAPVYAQAPTVVEQVTASQFAPALTTFAQTPAQVSYNPATVYSQAPTVVEQSAPVVSIAPQFSPTIVEQIAQQVSYAPPQAFAQVQAQAAPVTTTIAAPQIGMTSAPHIEYMVFQGRQVPFVHETHLRTLHPTALRQHAMLLYQHIGHQHIGASVPHAEHELLPWILRVQAVHLEPLRTGGIAAPLPAVVSSPAPGMTMMGGMMAPTVGPVSMAVQPVMGF